MEEKPNNELLREYAKSTNRLIFEEELPYPKSGIRTFQKFKHTIYIPCCKENTSFFVWFSDPYAKIGLPTIYSGVFIPISNKIKSKINIRKKNIIDKFNIFSKYDAKKIVNSRFDSKLIISGGIDDKTNEFLSEYSIQNCILEFLSKEELLLISLNEKNLDFVPELKNKSILSIINPQSWILNKDKIEYLFEQINIISACTKTVNFLK